MTADPEAQPGRANADLDALGDRLSRGRKSAGLDAAEAPERADAAAGDGLRVAIEFVVSTLVGAGLGWFIGGLAGSAVAGLLVGLLFGFAAGLRGVYRGMMAGSTPGKDGKGDDAGA